MTTTQTTSLGFIGRLRSGNGFASVLFRSLLKRRDVKVGLGILGFFFLLDLVSVIYLPYNPLAPVGAQFLPPSSKFLFGTTNLGQDVFSEWMFGTQATLLVGFLAALITALLG